LIWEDVTVAGVIQPHLTFSSSSPIQITITAPSTTGQSTNGQSTNGQSTNSQTTTGSIHDNSSVCVRYSIVGIVAALLFMLF